MSDRRLVRVTVAELEEFERALAEIKGEAFRLGLDEAGLHLGNAQAVVLRELWRREREGR